MEKVATFPRLYQEKSNWINDNIFDFHFASDSSDANGQFFPQKSVPISPVEHNTQLIVYNFVNFTFSRHMQIEKQQEKNKETRKQN